MKKFKRIQGYNKKYLNQLEKALSRLEPYIINVFVTYYGEEYKEHIEYTIKNIYYTYFLSETYFQVLVRKGVGIRNHDKRVAHYYEQYFNQLNHQINKMSHVDEVKIKFLQARIIKANEMVSILDLLECLSLDTSVYSVVSDEEELKFYKAIFLPIFTINLEMILHEINHALMVDAVATTDEEVIMPFLFINEECDEVFNELIARKVMHIYKENNFPVPYSLTKFRFANHCEDVLYLAQLFYYIFEAVIKRSVMTQNFNLLWEYAGREDFEEFCALIEKYYKTQECSKKEFHDLNELVFKMEKHAFIVENLSKEEDFAKLESMGYRVLRLK